jgi:hypothetical protein
MTREEAMRMPFTATLVERASGPKDSDEWMVTIDGFMTKYSKGIGHREGFKLPLAGATVADMRDFRDPRKSRTVDPTVGEVLGALACDASTVLDTDDLDDFAANYCPDVKPSELLRMYEACKDAALFFQKRGLDPADFNEDD